MVLRGEGSRMLSEWVKGINHYGRWEMITRLVVVITL